jgi:maltooligosyltrehalose trehalohydrolase
MGQEWAASTPFQYFTDHEPHLGRLVTEGRRSEFSGFAAFRDPATRAKIPDPQAETTFQRSKLHWEEIGEPRHAATLLLYREFFRLRRESPALHDRSRDNMQVRLTGDGMIELVFGKAGAEQCVVRVDLIGGHDSPRFEASRTWELLLSSNENRFGGDDAPPFAQPEVRVYRAA